MTTIQQAERERIDHLKEYTIGFASKFPTLIGHLLHLDDMLMRNADRDISEAYAKLEPVYDDR